MKRFVCCLIVLGLFASVARADSVELVNGDVISGKVISLQESQIKLQSDVLGEVIIPRDKAAHIHFGDRKPAAKAKVNAANPERKNGPKLLGQKSLGESVDQLKADGIDPGTVNAIKKKFPLLATPEANKYFDDRVNGLMTGRIDVQDIRKDAIKARDQLNDLRGDLRKQIGPGADGLLKMYSGILERFIEETEQPKGKSNKTAPQDEADLGEPADAPLP